MSNTEIIRGEVQAVNKGGSFTGKFGLAYKHGLKVNDTWVNYVDKSEESSYHQGDTVEIIAEAWINNNGEVGGWQTKKSQIKRLSSNGTSSTVTTTSSNPVKTATSGSVGVEVGHAYTNAVNIALARTQSSDTAELLDEIDRLTGEILSRTHALKEQHSKGVYTAPFTPGTVDLEDKPKKTAKKVTF